MRRISLLASLLITLSITTIPAEAKRRANPAVTGSSVEIAEQEVLRDLEQILDLWRDGRYDDLFERTTGGKDGKEQFAKKLASAPRKPACCWEKIQDPHVSLKGGQSALVRARLGFDGSVPGTQFVTKGIQLKKENGIWTISQSELLSLANFSRKRAVYKYLPAQKK